MNVLSVAFIGCAGLAAAAVFACMVLAEVSADCVAMHEPASPSKSTLAARTVSWGGRDMAPPEGGIGLDWWRVVDVMKRSRWLRARDGWVQPMPTASRQQDIAASTRC
jgi:hypothetical protein